MSFLKGGKFKPAGATETTTTAPASKPSPFGKKLGSFNKTASAESDQPKELDLDNQEELHAEEPVAPTKKPKLGAKKTLGGGLKKKQEAVEEIQQSEEVLAEVQTADEMPVEEVQEETSLTPEQEAEFCGDVTDNEEIEPETVEETVKKTVKKTTSTKKKTTSKKKTETVTDASSMVVPAENVATIDESKRVTSLEEIDALMRPVIAPTTEAWEQEKKDVLDALNAIKVEQDMSMAQVKTLLAELDNIRYEILPRQHDAETTYDGLKKNIETVQALGVANSTATNTEGRKAAAVLACKNHVMPNGEVVDLDMYMSLIKEKHKFYLKIVEAIDFRKYSLVNYNNALRIEANQ